MLPDRIDLPDRIARALRSLVRKGDGNHEEWVQRVQALRTTVDFALNATEREWAELVIALLDHGNLLDFIARRGACEAVRDNDPSWIQIGLVSLALGERHPDWREQLITLSLLAHSARKIGAPLDDYVQQVAEVASPAFVNLLQGYLTRPIREQAIKLMGYAESEDEDGFAYVQLDWRGRKPRRKKR